MLELLVLLIPVALVDSLSVWPACVVPMAIALGGPRPAATAFAFVSGIVAVYLPLGVGLALGLSSVIEAINERAREFWYHPDTLDMWLGLAIGLVMMALGWKVGVARTNRAERASRAAPPSLSPAAAFALGAGLTIAGAWGALPYFAAVDQILKLDPSTAGAVGALAWYNLAFVSPLLAFAALRPLLGARADVILERVNALVARWGRRVLVVALALFGAVIAADSVGWLLGRPLLPTGEPAS